MQYFRVACVAGVASVVAAAVGAHGGAGVPAAPWFPPLHYQAFAVTLLTAAASATLGRVLRMPSGPFLLTLAIGAILNVSGAATFELPRWLLTGAYALVGWSVGLHFTPEILAHAFRAFPKVLLSVGAPDRVLRRRWVAPYRNPRDRPHDRLSRNQPGRHDSVAIIAASSHVDMPFVITLQMVRFLTVIAIGPPIARFLARHAGPR